MIKKEVLARNMVRASFFVESKAHRRFFENQIRETCELKFWGKV